MGEHRAGRLGAAEIGYVEWLKSHPDDCVALFFLANLRRDQGRLSESAKLFRTLLARNPGHSEAWLCLGAVLKAQGDRKGAVHCYESAGSLRPDIAAPKINLGAVLFESGRWSEALECFDLAVQLDPVSAQAQSGRAAVLGALRRYAEALECIDRAIALAPDMVDAYCNRGNVLQDLQRFEEALAAFQKASALMPGFAGAYYFQGRVLQEMGRFQEALVVLDRAIALAPGYASCHNDRGVAFTKLARYEEAIAAFDRAIVLAPSDTDPLHNQSVALREAGRLEEAVAVCSRAIALNFPTAGTHHNDRGFALLKLGRYGEALADFDRAIALEPESAAAAYNNRGTALQRMRRFEESIAPFEKALEIQPDFVSASYNLGITDLYLGNYRRGWANYEYRWRREKSEPCRHGNLARWNGESDVAGKSILLWSEQGYGDVVQFCRYAPLVAALGARVVLEVPAALTLLLRSLGGVSSVHAVGEVLPECELQIPLMSLPNALKTTLTSVPAHIPYLRVDPERIESWRQRFAARPAAMRIGIASSGNPLHHNDRNRSISLSELEAIFPFGSFYLLQKQVAERDLPYLRGHPMEDLGTELVDFRETAAAIENLDLIISVDTSVAHVAGALGKPVWILLPADSEWRWMCDRGDSPWYPNARLFRQEKLGDWKTPVLELARELNNFSPNAT